MPAVGMSPRRAGAGGFEPSSERTLLCWLPAYCTFTYVVQESTFPCVTHVKVPLFSDFLFHRGSVSVVPCRALCE